MGAAFGNSRSELRESEKMAPSLAVVIPVYNSERTVGSAIRSVLRQTRQPDEVIVVDDGSTDGTVDVIGDFRDRVRLIRQPNRGTAMARQTGTDVASSEYVAYLDADDWWLEDTLEKASQHLTAEPIHFMFADLQRARPGDPPEDYKPRNTRFFPWARRYFGATQRSASARDLYRLEPEQAQDLLLEGFPAFPSTMVVHRDALAYAGGWDSRFERCQDFDFSLRLTRHFPLHFFDRVQAIVGLHGGNSNRYRYVVMQTEGDIQVLRAHIASEHRGSPWWRRLNRALAMKQCNLGWVHRQAGDSRRARAAYLQAATVPGRRVYALARYASTWVRGAGMSG